MDVWRGALLPEQGGPWLWRAPEAIRQERPWAENQAGQQGIAGMGTAMNTGIALASVAASPLESQRNCS